MTASSDHGELADQTDYDEYISRTLETHVKLGREKPVSYLPVDTIEKLIGISIPEYRRLVENEGNKSIELSRDECCIKSGAVYAYNDRALSMVLNEHRELIVSQCWALDPESFVRRLAVDWLDERHPLMDVIRLAFGDTSGT